MFRRLEDRRVLDVSAAFVTATGQLDILIANTADTANISTTNGEMVITDGQNRPVAIQVNGARQGTVNASDVDAVQVRGDTATEQTVILHSPLPLPKGLVIDRAIERAEIRAAITRVSSAEIHSDAALTQLAADLEVSDGDIVFGGDVRLSGDIQLTATNVRFDGQVDDDGNTATGSNLLVRATGLTRFSASVGTSAPITRIETDALGRTELNGNVVASGNTILFSDPVTLTSDVSITDTGSTGIVFGSTIDSANGQLFRLSLSAPSGRVELNGSIGASSVGDPRLGGLVVEQAATGVLFGNVQGVTTVNILGNVDIGQHANPIGGTGILLNGGASNFQLNTFGGSLRFHGPVSLRTDVLLTTSNGNIIFTNDSPIDSQPGEANRLSLDAPAGFISIQAAIGSSTRVGSIHLQRVDNSEFASVTAARIIQSNGTNKTIFRGSLDLNVPNNVALELRGHEFEFHAAVLAVGDGRVQINHTGLLDVNAAADMRLDGTFFENGGGPVDLAGNIATSGGLITFNGPVRLTDGTAGNILLSTVASGVANGADIHFANSLNGQTSFAENLLLNAGLAGDVLFDGPVGNVTSLGSATVVQAENITINQTFFASRFVQLAGQGTTRFNGIVALGHPLLPAMAINTVNVSFGAPLSTTGEGSVNIQVSGVLELLPGANFTLNGSFHQRGSGVAHIAANIVTRGLDVLFDSPVRISGDVLIQNGGSGGGRVVFGQTLNAARTFFDRLHINAALGTVEFLGPIGGSDPLAAIVIEQAGDVILRSPSVVQDFVQSLGTGTTTIRAQLEARATSGSIDIRNRFIDVQANTIALTSPVSLKADENLLIGANLLTETTPIALEAKNDILIGSSVNISTRAGDILVSGDSDRSGSGEVRMDDGALLQSLLSSIRVSAGDDITLARLVSPLPILLTSTNGGIIDSGDTGGINIEAPTVALRAATGIGTANIVETRIGILAAVNTGPGGVRVTNDVDGPLSIGAEDGLAGLVDGGTGRIEIINQGSINVDGAIRNGGGGDTILRAEFFPGGNLTVNQPIQNTGGDGFILLFAGGDLTIRNSLPEPRDANGNQIENPTNPEQFFEIYAVGEGGVRGEAAGQITIDNAEQNFVIVRTETGQITNVRPILSIETVDQGGSDVDAIGRAFVKVTLGNNVHLETNYQVTIDWGDGEIEHFPIPGTINPLRQQFKGNTETRFVSGAEGEEGVYFFLHRYFANPNVVDPSAPIAIRVEARHDPRSSGNTAIDANRPSTASGVFNGIRFFENVADEVFTSRTDFFTLAGIGGLGFIKVVDSVIVPVESRAPTAELPIRTAPAFAGSFGAAYEPPVVSFDSETQEEYRVFMRVVDDVLGTESEDIPLDLSVLDDPVAIFRRIRFPNGHYRIYLEELRTHRTRVILDVYIYNGRVVPPDFRAGTAEKPVGADEQPAAQPQPNQNGDVRPAVTPTSAAAAESTHLPTNTAKSNSELESESQMINAGVPVGAAAATLPQIWHKRSFSKAARTLRRGVLTR